MIEESNRKPVEWIEYYAAQIGEREEKLGGPVPGTPTFRDMAILYRAFEWLDKNPAPLPADEVYALMELISDVRDAWVDPEADAIGKELFPILSEIHFNLGKRLDEAVPEQKESRERLENLRALQRAMRRQAATHTPGIIESLWNAARTKFKRQ